MTGVEFHVNQPDKLAFACRLLRKAVAKGAKVVVTGEPQLLEELDRALWTFEATEFLPHCRGETACAAVLEASPVILAASARTAAHRQVLVNLGGTVPDGFEQFERLLEVVSVDETDRQLGRQRWKHYAGRGYALIKHDALASKESS